MWRYPHYQGLHYEGMVRKWEIELKVLPAWGKFQIVILIMVVTAAIAAAKAVADLNRIVYAIVLFAAARKARPVRQARQARQVRLDHRVR